MRILYTGITCNSVWSCPYQENLVVSQSIFLEKHSCSMKSFQNSDPYCYWLANERRPGIHRRQKREVIFRPEKKYAGNVFLRQKENISIVFCCAL